MHSVFHLCSVSQTHLRSVKTLLCLKMHPQSQYALPLLAAFRRKRSLYQMKFLGVMICQSALHSVHRTLVAHTQTAMCGGDPSAANLLQIIHFPTVLVVR